MDLDTILKKLFISLLVFSLIFPQKVYTFTEEEVKSLFSSIKELERQDSLNNEFIINLENKFYMPLEQRLFAYHTNPVRKGKNSHWRTSIFQYI